MDGSPPPITLPSHPALPDQLTLPSPLILLAELTQPPSYSSHAILTLPAPTTHQAPPTPPATAGRMTLLNTSAPKSPSTPRSTPLSPPPLPAMNTLSLSYPTHSSHGEATPTSCHTTHFPTIAGPLSLPPSTTPVTSVAASASSTHHSPTLPIHPLTSRKNWAPVNTQNDKKRTSVKTQPASQSTRASAFYDRWAPRVECCQFLVKLDEVVTGCSLEWHSLTSNDGLNTTTSQPPPLKLLFWMSKTRKDADTKRDNSSGSVATLEGTIKPPGPAKSKGFSCAMLGA